MQSLTRVLAAGALVFSSPIGSFSGAAFAQSAAEAGSIEDIAARFGARQSVLQVSLSPSGTKIAWIAAGPEHTEILNVYDLTSTAGVQAVVSNSEKSGDLARCEWVTDERLICQVVGMARRGDGLLLPYDRMFAINADGSDAQQISDRRSRLALGFNQDGGDVVALDVDGEEGKILVTRNFVPEVATGTRMGSDKQGLGVARVDIGNGRSRNVEPPDPLATRYVADENGEVRLKVRTLENSSGMLTGGRIHMYRDPGKRGWRELDNATLDGQTITGFAPIAVSARENALYAYHTIDGFDAIIRIALDGSGIANVLMARDDVDVDGLIRIGRQRRVVGASYATEKRSAAYFDQELAKLSSDLNKALPNQPLIDIAGASADENRLVILASSDTDPGTVYLYDKTSRNLEQLLAMRDYLVDRPMGPMTSIMYPASDGTQIPGYLTLPPGSDGKDLPAIILPHGGPAARDFWGFDWLVQFFTARGYAVLQPNYRGSSGYGEAWYGRNGFKAWDVAIGDVNDAGKWLVSTGVANPDQLAIAGWSYGGYAALQSQVVEPDLFKAVVAIAPVTDLGYLRSDARGYTNARLVRDYVGSGPHIEEGSPRRHAEGFKAPVALFHGTLDLNVDVRHSRGMEDALEDAGKSVRYFEYDDLQHDLGDNKVRYEMLMEIDAFLNEALSR